MSYSYWFSTVDKRSMRLYPRKETGEIHRVGQEVYSFVYQEGLQESVPYDDTVMEYLYSYEVNKSKEYCTKKNLSLEPADDWLYSLYMHVKHEEDRKRLLLTIPKGTHIISYGDRTASLKSEKVESYDKFPSRYSLGPVKKATEMELRMLVKGRATLVLMYVFDLMSPQEQLLVKGAQCPVLVWGTHNPPFIYNRLGVSANSRMTLPWLTEELRPQPEFPYSENISRLGIHDYADDGPQLQALLRAGLYKEGVPVHKSFQPVSFNETPLKVLSKGTLVVHAYTTLRQYLRSCPYFIPVGRKVDRILTVTRPMRAYQRFTLYHFRNASQFSMEINNALFVSVYKEDQEIVGFFYSTGEGVGMTVTESTIGKEEAWARAYPLGFIVETRRKAYNFSLSDSSFEDAFQDMSGAERSSLYTALLNSPSCRLLKEAWIKRIEAIT